MSSPIVASQGVTILVNPHPAKTNNDLLREIGARPGEPEYVYSDVELLPGSLQRRLTTLWDSTFAKRSTYGVFPEDNGFVRTAMHAYNQHKNLVIRPDDVWLSILSQFSYYVNAHSEELRSCFVAHKGKKDLVAKATNFPEVIRLMSDAMKENIKDPSLRDWMVPNFSTTTEEDRLAMIAMSMATLKAYFGYQFGIMCGIPSVTMLGTRDDWEKLYKQAARLLEFKVDGKVPEDLSRWHRLLETVLHHFLKSYENPEDPYTAEFWNYIGHYKGGGSGPTYLSGWITAFCVFNDKGKWQVKDTAETWSQIHNGCEIKSPSGTNTVTFPLIDTEEIPASWTEVDVLVDMPDGSKFPSTLAAGSIGFQSCKVGENGKVEDAGGENDAVRPVTAWWCFASKPVDEIEEN